jgi:transposase-like protein
MRSWKCHAAEEIANKLERVDALVSRGQSVTSAADAVGISVATYFRWRKQYGGLRPTHLEQIRTLEAEVAHLRAIIEVFDELQ